jgi:hypothetical protein
MDAQPARGRRTTGRFTIFLGLLSAAALSSGCAQGPGRSLARAWDDLPKIRWSTSRDAADEQTARDADIAAKSASESDLDESSLGSSLANRFKFSNWSNEANRAQPTDDASTASSGPHDPFLEDEIGRARLTSDDVDAEIAGDDVADAPKVASQRDRLRAALSDDSRRNREPEIDLAEQERLRVRIESLMIRATQYLEQGELDKAQRDAELAQHLADVCSLEFAPDEDRPVDLLAEIVARLEFLAAQANEEPETAPAPEAADDDVAVVPNDVTEFDPYSDRGSPAQPTRPTPHAASSLVVLEAPSFEDAENEPAVSPTAYARSAGISRSALDLSSNRPLGDLTSQLVDQAVQTATLPPVETSPSLPELEAPPPLEGPSFGDTELPPEQDLASAPAPPAGKVAPPKRGTVTLEDIEAEPSANGEDEKKILTAQAIPQWMVLACLSALAAAVSLWLIRRRALASF